VGGLDDDAASAVRALSPTRVALGTGGPNFTVNSADDELVVIDGVGTTNAITRVPIGGLDEGVQCQVLPVGVSALLVENGGANGVLGGGDDRITLVTGLPGASSLQSVAMDGDLADFFRAFLPDLLGRGRAACINSGANNTIGGGHDDQIRVIEGLPQPRAIEVSSLDLKFNAGNPNKKQVFNVKGALAIDAPSLLGGGDLTVSLGNAAERIPASKIKKKSNGIFEFVDPNGKLGFVHKLTLNPTRGTFSITGQGRKTGVETTLPAYVPVALEVNDLYLSDLVVGTSTSSGIRFRS
jgi:hypothetical protein